MDTGSSGSEGEGDSDAEGAAGEPPLPSSQEVRQQLGPLLQRKQQLKKEAAAAAAALQASSAAAAARRKELRAAVVAQVGVGWGWGSGELCGMRSPALPAAGQLACMPQVPCMHVRLGWRHIHKPPPPAHPMHP